MRSISLILFAGIVGSVLAEPVLPSTPAQTPNGEAAPDTAARAGANPPDRVAEEAGVAVDFANAIDAADTTALREKWGIEIASLRTTANGYLLDFRFRVVEPEKTGCIFDVRKKPCLIDQETGAKFAVPAPPKVGALRTSRKPKPGTISFLLFGNPGCYVAPGKKVAITIDDFVVKNLVVEDPHRDNPKQ